MLRTYKILQIDRRIKASITMPRPSGQFLKSEFKLLSLIKRLAGLGACFATTKFLSKQINRCERQTKRYLNSLEEKKIIKSYTSKLLRDPLTGKLYRRRLIRIRSNFTANTSGPKLQISEEWQEVINTNEDELTLAFDKMKQDQERILLERLFSDENDPYKQFDMEAVAKELQQELANQGVFWEM